MIFSGHQIIVNSAKDIILSRLRNRLRRRIPKGYVTDSTFCLFISMGLSYNRSCKFFVVRGSIDDSSGKVCVTYRVFPTAVVLAIQLGMIFAFFGGAVSFLLDRVSVKILLICFFACLLYFVLVAGQSKACREYFERSIAG